VRTKRGYLASVLLAGVMIAGYLGMLPLLQSLAAEPAWPDAPPALAGGAAAAPLVVTYVAPPAAQTKTEVVRSKPAKVKKAKKSNANAKAAKRTTPRTGSPARATGSNTNANRPSGGGDAVHFGGSGGSGGSNAGEDNGSCAGC
jgi:hypothetical protein